MLNNKLKLHSFVGSILFLMLIYLKVFYVCNIYEIKEDYLIKLIVIDLLQFILFIIPVIYLIKTIKNFEDFKKKTSETTCYKRNFLRSQIDLHFLFNSLNLIYDKLYTVSEESANLLLNLSKQIQYVLINTRNLSLVNLSEEIEHLYDIISIFENRQNKKSNLKITINGNPLFCKIEPQILTTLIENILKFGDLDDQDDPSIFQIVIYAKELKIIVKNRISQRSTKLKGMGIGISNLKDRLDLSYSNKYLLIENINDKYYTLNLTIPTI